MSRALAEKAEGKLCIQAEENILKEKLVMFTFCIHEMIGMLIG